MNRPPPAKMVGWYDPGQLTKTGIEVLISTVFGQYADQRLIQALASGPGVIYDFTKAAPELIPLGHSPGAGLTETAMTLKGVPVAQGQSQPRPEAPIWIDFVADTGDGWDSTYAVAKALTLPHAVTYGGPNGQDKSEVTTPGELLLFGGDEVYPTASRSTYEQRLVEPFRAAFGQGPYPTVFALPGNHDWYDNLVSFSRLFCSNEPFAGPPHDADQPAEGCLTPQRRSYFALKLPGGWWLLGTDVQLGSDLDGPQYDFFTEVLKKMTEGDRVILCTPEPHWVYAEALETAASQASKNALDSLELLLAKKVKIAVFIAGDVHHYCRYESTTGTSGHKVHKITSGGGGAFLHPTHGPLNVQTLKGNPSFEKKAVYPPTGTSWWLGCRNFLFPLWNLKFGLATAVLYTFILWAAMPAIEEYPRDDQGEWYGADNICYGLYKQPLGKALYALLLDSNLDPGFIHQRIFIIAFAVFVMTAFGLFTDLRRWYGKALAGILHGGAHFLVALFLAWAASVLASNCPWLTPKKFDPQAATFWHFATFWFATLFVFVTGWLAGSFLMGIYLFLMLNVFNRHWNEGFSSLAIPDWKNFLRLRIGPDGTLTIFAIGIRDVPRTRSQRASAPPGALGPAIEIKVELIEPPVEVHPQ